MRFRIWLIIVTAVFVRIAFGIQFQSVSAVGPFLIDELVLAYVSLGTLIGAYSISGVALALPGSWLLARLGNKRMLLLSLGLMTLGGGMMAAASGFPLLLAGRFVSGTGYVLLSVALPKLVLDHTPPGSLGMVMGIYIAGYPIGVAVAMSGLPLIGNWQLEFLTSALLCGVSGAVVALVLPRDPSAKAEVAATRFRLDRASWGPLLTVSLTWALCKVMFAILLGFLPTFFVARGMTVARGAGLTGLIGYAGLPVMPFGAWILSRTTGTMPGILMCLMAFLAVPPMLLLEFDPVPTLVFGGLMLGLYAGPLFALAGAPLRPDERALAMGLFYTIYHASMTFPPPFGGLARDLTGDPGAPVYVALLFGVVGVAAQVARTLVGRGMPAMGYGR